MNLEQSLLFICNSQIGAKTYKNDISRLAKKYHLHGWIQLKNKQVELLIQGEDCNLQSFALAFIALISTIDEPVIMERILIADDVDYFDFNIRE